MANSFESKVGAKSESEIEETKEGVFKRLISFVKEFYKQWRDFWGDMAGG